MDFRPLLIAAGLLWLAPASPAGDWPQWRSDSSRSGATSATMPPVAELHLQWTRQLPPLVPAFRDGRLQFDRGYEPIVLGKRLLVGSSHDDSVIALDTESGELLWRFVTGGPVRFAPVAWRGQVYFGSDDGHLYCVDAERGQLRWKFRAVPSARQMFGNRRLISAWPVRGGPVIRDGRIYFAAGVWSFEGVFVYALDAESGKPIWLNDDCSYIYGIHPHNAVAFGGLAPQGYLLINGDELIVPSSSAYPAKLDLQTGELIDFKLPAAGRKPGGWFVATAKEGNESKLGLLPSGEVARKRELLYERAINQKRHEGEMKVQGQAGVQRSISVGDQRLDFDTPIPGVRAKVHSLVAGDDKLFVVTEGGAIHCLGAERPDQPTNHDPAAARPIDSAPGAREILEESGVQHGLAIVVGAPDASFLETLAARSKLDVVVIDRSGDQVATLRETLADRGLNGHRISVRQGDELPPYLAALVTSIAPLAPADLRKISDWVRPFGGKLIVPRSPQLAAMELPGFSVAETGDQLVLTRTSLPGSTNYTGGWQESMDQLVRAPLGVLWFDDTLSHFKRSPQPRFVDGVMISADKKWTDTSTRGDKIDYRLQTAVYSDVYTGRVLDPTEIPLLSAELGEFDLEQVQPSQYRPPGQKNHWKPEPPKVGTRRNPLTGLEEPRTFPKSYGCDGGVDYGHLYSMRSGTAAIYDKRLESGTINLSGPRSGCTNSIIPANGVLNVPYFFEGCTCSYPLPTALALVSLPPTHEQWASWGDVPAEAIDGKIRRLGINFGAPGDRMTEAGTLWLDHPNIGGPSPQIQVEVSPANEARYEYRHSLWIQDPSPSAWPWVSASAVIGARQIRVAGLEDGQYEVRLFFAELEEDERSFDITVQGDLAEQGFSPSRRAGGPMTATVLKVPSVQVDNGSLLIQLSPQVGETSLSGIELISSKELQGEAPETR